MFDYVSNDKKKLLKNEHISAAINLTEVSLNTSLLKLPGSKLFCKVLSDQEELKTKPFSLKENIDQINIKLGPSRTILIILYSSGFLFGTKELGRCEFTFNTQKVTQIKMPIIFQHCQIGHIQADFLIINKKYNNSTQSTCNSLDMRDEFIKDSTHLDLNLFKPMNLYSHFLDTKDREFDLSGDENSENSMHSFIEKVAAKKKKILGEKEELFLSRQNLNAREEKILSEKSQVAIESEKIRKEQEHIQKMIAQLNCNFSQLKNDKFRNKAHKKIIDKMKSRVSANLNRLTREKSSFFSKKVSNDQDKENLDYSVLGLSESVLPIKSSESPVPDENFFEDFSL